MSGLRRGRGSERGTRCRICSGVTTAWSMIDAVSEALLQDLRKIFYLNLP